MRDFPYFLVILLMAASGLSIFIYILVYNIRNLRFINGIKKAYRDEGKIWPYWSDTTKRIKLFLDPESIFSEDSHIGIDAKRMWYGHRKAAKKYFRHMVLISFGAFALAILLLIANLLFP